MREISREISDFFRAANEANADGFIFTTFSLDEQILVTLLQTHRVRTDCRIVVLHDLMKRHKPGFLRQFYPDSTVVSVTLTNTNVRVPIFHSKLWMAIRNIQCVVLAAPSLNLRRYHLDQGYKTFETFPWWSGLSIPIRTISKLDKLFTWQKANTVRLKLTARTIVVDDRQQPPVLSDCDRAAIALIREVENRGQLIGCAAPFVGKRAIEALRRLNELPGRGPTIWSERHKNGTALHAKLIETTKYMFLGSANLTCQALGVDNPGNHEALVIGRRGTLKLQNVLKGFPRIKIDELSAMEDEESADRSPEDDYEDWSERRKLAANGPREVRLALVRGRVFCHADAMQIILFCMVALMTY
jgi:hypothetical protein